MAKVIVFHDGNVIHDVISDEPIEIMFLDQDTDGGDEGNVKTVDQNEYYVTAQTSHVNEEVVERIWKQGSSENK